MTIIANIAAVAGTEFRISLRNWWVVLATAIFTLFALALTFSGTGGAETKAGQLSLAAANIATLSVYLIPLIALLISYDSFAGEVERGTLALVLATPVSRAALLAGKLLGLIVILAIAMVSGLVISSLAAGLAYGFDPDGLVAIARLAVTGLLLGSVFIAIGMLVSMASPRTGAAAALAVGVWLLAVVLYDLALLAGILSDSGGFFTRTLFPYLVIANPGDAFRIFNLALLSDKAPVSGLDGIASTLPFDTSYAIAALVFWLAAILAASYARIRRLAP